MGSGMYEEIGRIARQNWNSTISFGELAEMIGVNSAWHAGQQVQRAWDYFDNRGDSATCSAISRVFRGKNWR